VNYVGINLARMVQLVTHIVWQHLKAKHLLQMPQRWQGSHVDLIAAALHTPKMKEFGPKKKEKMQEKRAGELSQKNLRRHSRGCENRSGSRASEEMKSVFLLV